MDRRHILGWAAGLAAAPVKASEPPPPRPDGDASGLTVRPTGAPTARTLANRAADEVNILDFGAPADGIGDDLPAFEAARDSVPRGGVARIRMPSRSYRLSRTPPENDRRVVVIIDEGATFTGPNKPYGSRVVMGGGSQHNESLAGKADEHEMIGDAVAVRNNGSRPGYGYRFEYISDARTAGGGDIAQATVCQWNSLDNGLGAFGAWTICVTPETKPDARWMVVCGEFNAVNRGADQGWAPLRSTHPTMTGIHQYGPMNQSFAGPTGNHILFAQCFFQSAEQPHARTYNIQLVEPDAIAPAGYYAYVQGSTEDDPARWPAAPISIVGAWRDGYRADRARIQTGAAYSVGPGQFVAYRDATGAIIACDMAGPGAPEGVVRAPAGSTWRRTDPAPGRRFYVKESGDNTRGWVAK